MIARERLEAFERALDPDHPEAGGFEIVAYGEISVVVALDDTPDVVLKRMSGFRTADEVAHYADAVAAYVDALRLRGVDVIDTEVAGVHTERHGHVAFVVQPRVPAQHLGAAWLHRDDEGALDLMGRIWDVVADTYARNDTAMAVAVDSQVSNWSWDGERLGYLDVGTPFLREQGRERLDWSLIVRPLPPILRGAVLRFVVPGVVQRYHELDKVVVDVVANLVKEGRPDLVAAAVGRANGWAEGRGVPIALTAREIHSYYAGDARLWEVMWQVRRATRWAYGLVGQPYGFLLPGPTRRR